jgi:Bardet-Biedl syndrome 5 protein
LHHSLPCVALSPPFLLPPPPPHPPRYLALRKGEFLIDTLSSVEDTKGSTGERGQLTLTNLRLFWQSHSRARSTISIGLGCVQSLAIKSATSRLRGGVTQALCVTAKSLAGGPGVAPPGGRYEFIFTSLVKASPRLFGTSQGVLRAHETSKLFRDLKMRGAVIKDR